MALNHDNQGFLVGERLDAEDITGRLDAIRDEVRSLRHDLSRGSASMPPATPRPSANETAGERRESPSPQSRLASPSGAEASRDEVLIRIDRPAEAATPPDRQAPGRYVYRATGNAGTGGENSTASTKGVATPLRERDASGQFAARPPTASPGRDTSSAGDKAGGGRGPDGRFTAGGGRDPSAGDDEPGLLSRSIDGLSDRLSGAVQEMGAGTEEADPAVKAFNEVAEPLQRGFSKILGDGDSRKQERWYRRFWMMMRGSRREDRAADKQQRRILKNIERKPSGGDNGSMLWRGLMLLLAPITGMLSLLGGLPMALAGAVITGLKALLTAMGLGRVARRMTVPGSGRSTPRRGGGGSAGRAAARGGASGTPAARPSGQGGTTSRPGASTTQGGSRFGRLLKGGARRIPGIGALLGLGFMASDIAASEGSDASRAEKDVTTGRAIGGGLGGIGGMAGGAAAGAAIGSVVPGIGTAIGGIIGAAAGGFFGGSAGEVVGEKVGGWVTDLRKSNLVQGLSQRWEYATTFMSSLWEQTSEGVSARWESATATFSSLWDSATQGLSDRWESLSNTIAERWTAVTDEMKGLWDSAVSLAAEGWGALTDMAEGANAWIAEKTGVDVAETARETGQWVSDRAIETSAWVSERAGSAADWAGERADAAAAWTADRAEVAADRFERAAGWLGNKLSSGASWLGEKTGISSAVGMVRNAHNEAAAVPALTQAMAEAGITDPNEQAAFMGQMHHESGGFRTMEESFNYRSADRIMEVSATARNQGREAIEAAMAQGPEAVAELMYGGRMGNTEAGDGYRYRGRGFTQLTGRDNYSAASEALGVDLVNNPDLAAARAGEFAVSSSPDGPPSVAGVVVTGAGDTASASTASVARADGLTGVWPSPSRPPVGVSTQPAVTIPAPRAPALAEAPSVSTPMSSPQGQGGDRQPSRGPEDVSRDVPDRRIAHIVTGAYSGMG
ncbi:glycoside hydrolase family 19 protein [Ectothiorhodospira mobilis]|uniref:glycoside hydrolase family 19 protein n=1 Tax=Ectothiorhodospira mobilis TaxID=195064 RepID=UPI001905D292|nr:glycoside hydrolase family 19 protein [Ectothiorhodospira mobilis]